MPNGLVWSQQKRGPYIKTVSGRRVYLADPNPDDFHVPDIACHLAGINRYTGGSRYSVAQHCVVAARAAKRLYPAAHYLPAKMLIHDASEFACGDVSSPLKSLLTEYRLIEGRVQLAIERKFDCLFIDDPLVAEIDMRMWLTERNQLFGGTHGPQAEDYRGEQLPFSLELVDEDWFVPWTADEAEGAWMFEYRRLFPWMQ